jgi:hypothetical protein
MLPKIRLDGIAQPSDRIKRTEFASVGIAVTVALLMRGPDFDWLAIFVTAAVTSVVLPDMLLSETADG